MIRVFQFFPFLPSFILPQHTKVPSGSSSRLHRKPPFVYPITFSIISPSSVYLLLFLQEYPRNVPASRSKAKPFFAAQPDARMISNSPCALYLDVGHVYGVNYSWSNRWWNIILFLVFRPFRCWVSDGCNASFRGFCCENISVLDAGGVEWEIPGSGLDFRTSTHRRSSPPTPNSMK